MEAAWPFHASRAGYPAPGSDWFGLSLEDICRAGTPEPAAARMVEAGSRVVPSRVDTDQQRRSSLVYIADLAERCGRYIDVLEVFSCMLTVPIPPASLTRGERDLLSAGLKGCMDPCRRVYRARLSARAGDEELAETAAREYRGRAGAEIRALGVRACTLLHGSGLIQSAISRGRADDVAFYERMLGDYARYAAETDDNLERSLRAADEARSAYDRAVEASRALPAAHPVRLSVVLNYSAFLADGRGRTSVAIKLARDSVTRATRKMTAAGERLLSHEEKRDGAVLIAQILENVSLWEGDAGP
jgi:hypothetical protein